MWNPQQTHGFTEANLNLTWLSFKPSQWRFMVWWTVDSFVGWKYRYSILTKITSLRLAKKANNGKANMKRPSLKLFMQEGVFGMFRSCIFHCLYVLPLFRYVGIRSVCFSKCSWIKQRNYVHCCVFKFTITDYTAVGNTSLWLMSF